MNYRLYQETQPESVDHLWNDEILWLDTVSNQWYIWVPTDLFTDGHWVKCTPTL